MRGFVEAANGRWEEATPFIERFVKYNPKYGFANLTLAMLYAQIDSVQEARAMLNKGTEKWPSKIKNVRWYMTNLPFKDHRTAKRFAEGYVKAGLWGESTDFYKISSKDKLTGEALRRLFFGRKATGFTLATGKPWWIKRSKDGKATIMDGDKSDRGKSWVEDDMLCDQWDHLYESLKDCWVVYRNPEGTPENNDEYLGAPGYGIYPFSLVE